MHLSDLQARLAGRFAAQDRASGLPFLVSVLQEEVGELARAARKGQEREAGEEAVDVLFMALSVCNALGYDAEPRLRAKFLERPLGEVRRSWTDLPGSAPPAQPHGREREGREHGERG